MLALPPSDQERLRKAYERIVKAGYPQNPVAALQRVFLGNPFVPTLNAS
jgi:hypothetical protein